MSKTLPAYGRVYRDHFDVLELSVQLHGNIIINRCNNNQCRIHMRGGGGGGCRLQKLNKMQMRKFVLFI